MKTDEQIIELISRKHFDSARYACIERLKHNHLDTSSWSLLGQSLTGMGRGKVAELCFRRVALLNPFADWIDRAIQQARSIDNKYSDAQVTKLLLDIPHPTVSAVILTKNSSRTIGSCIQALIPAVDEIVVVDTGSTDDTIQIVEQFGLAVHTFEWCDDFATARNYAQSLVASDWSIAIDSDEILYQDDTDSIREVAGLLDHLAGTVVSLVQMNVTGDSVNPYATGRMFKRDSGLCWQKPIHEEILPVHHDTPIQHIKARIRVHHDGYDPRIPNHEDKIMRNISVLERMLRDNPNDYQACFYFGREHRSLGRYEDAITYLLKALQIAKSNNLPAHPENYHALYQSYCALKQFDNASDIMRQLTEQMPNFPDGWFYSAAAMMDHISAQQQVSLENLKRAKQTAPAYQGIANHDPYIATWKADYLIAHLTQSSGNLIEAHRLFKQVLQHNPKLHDVAVHLDNFDNQILSLAQQIEQERRLTVDKT